ncbi:SDR family NAD(P)-dependent oxidoreductase [uncultured Erythrobacter sp.]|uniref:SDR family NAD(P)-dependent oxidoreductase n=1 Tax=uncultured Erythrobacter sp. TaxID=263913 RepID=UPI002605DDF0|nr:SDR family NAD(P)-dependent oxidoreductase [uncultured Erythrobacter sp.]
MQRKTILLAGASGTIGRAVAHALLADGHDVVCLLRDSESGREAAQALKQAGAAITFGDWSDVRADTVVSCIASRTGSPKDARAVDYQANADLLAAAEKGGVKHFILLSAICVQRPRLAFQHAKLAFEAELQASPIDWTVIRPTAFFKSLSGQVERVRKGKPFLLFGDGQQTRCKPISDGDLARFIADCVTNPGRCNQVLPVGGPGPAISPREQGEMLFELTGQEPRYRSISPSLFKAASRVLSLGAGVSGWLAEKAEYARIAHYYATESMLVLNSETVEYDADATPEFGSDTLHDHYATLLAAQKEQA